MAAENVPAVTRHVATPDARVTAPHVKAVPLLVKVTVPVGAPLLDPTFAVKVTKSVVRLGFRDEESTVLVARVTITVIGDDVVGA